MAKPTKFGGFTLYRIYHGDDLVYLGRTKQPLKDRIRGHLFKKPMHRVIHIEQVSKIEYATFESEADMYLYEIYFINLWRPALNRDDKAADAMTITLPDVEWKLFVTNLWEKWRNEIAAADAAEKDRRDRKFSILKKDAEMRQKRRNGEISEAEYWGFWEKEVKPL